jgi:hypothetical protein
VKNVGYPYLSSQLRDRAAYARFVFPTTVDAVSMFDSFAGSFALCSAILAALIGRDPAEARAGRAP